MAAGVSITWVGQRALLLRLALAKELATAKLAKALYSEGQRILADAIPLTPIDTGSLRASGHVKPPEVAGDTVVVQIGFGGAAAPYAVYVHERLDLSHAAPTQAKFLETPLLARRADFAKRLNLELKI